MINIVIFGKNVYLRKAIRSKIKDYYPEDKDNIDTGDYETLIKNNSKYPKFVVLFILNGDEMNISHLLAPLTSSHVEVLCLIPDNQNLVETLTCYNYKFIKLPLNMDDLNTELNIIREQREKVFSREGYSNSMEPHESHISGIDKEDFPYKNGIVVIDATRIIIVEASVKKSILSFIWRTPQIIDLTFKEMINRLVKYDIFQANRGQAINFNEVSDLDYSYGGCFTMNNHIKVFVSQKYIGIIAQYMAFVVAHRKK